MLGAGSSLVYTPSVAILGHYFSKRLGIVNGFVTTGSSIFAVGLPHILKFLFAEIGVSNRIRIDYLFVIFLMKHMKFLEHLWNCLHILDSWNIPCIILHDIHSHAGIIDF